MQRIPPIASQFCGRQIEMITQIFTIQRFQEAPYSVEKLYNEIKWTAELRGHQSLFQKEQTLKEKRRFQYIREGMLKGNYVPVALYLDEKKNLIWVEDGFHRIIIAHDLGWKEISCTIYYGTFEGEKVIPQAE